MLVVLAGAGLAHAPAQSAGGDPPAPWYIDGLLAALRDESADIRFLALATFEVLLAEERRIPDVSRYGMGRLQEAPFPPTLVRRPDPASIVRYAPDVGECLDDVKAPNVSAALIVLGHMAEHDASSVEPLVPELVDLLENAGSEHMIEALRVLRAVARFDRSAVARHAGRITPCLATYMTEGRLLACEILDLIDEADKRLIHDAIDDAGGESELGDEELHVLLALASRAPERVARYVPRIVDALTVPKQSNEAAATLAALAEHRPAAVAPYALELLAQLQNTERRHWVRPASLTALAFIAPHVGDDQIDEVLSSLHGHMNDRREGFKVAAIRAFGAMLARRPGMIERYRPSLRRLLASRDRDVWVAALGAYIRLDECTAESLLLDDVDFGNLFYSYSWTPETHAALDRFLDHASVPEIESFTRRAWVEIVGDTSFRRDPGRDLAVALLTRGCGSIADPGSFAVERLAGLRSPVWSDRYAALESIPILLPIAPTEVLARLDDVVLLQHDPDSYAQRAAREALRVIVQDDPTHTGLLVDTTVPQLTASAYDVRIDAMRVLADALADDAGVPAALTEAAIIPVLEKVTSYGDDERSAARRLVRTLAESSADQLDRLVTMIEAAQPSPETAAATAAVLVDVDPARLAPAALRLASEMDPEGGNALTVIEVIRAVAAHDREGRDTRTRALNVNLFIADEDYRSSRPVELERAARAAYLEGSGGPGTIEDVIALLTVMYGDPQRIVSCRFWAHILGGGAEGPETLLTWIGEPGANTSRRWLAGGPRDILILLLNAFDAVDFVEESRGATKLRADIARSIGRVVAEHGWWERDIGLLKVASRSLRSADFPEAAIVDDAIDDMQQRWARIKTGGLVVLAALTHCAFWIGLLCLYPRSRHVQSFFFWNRWTRRILGLGYVNIALTTVPPLRRLLFAPFRETLVADANLATFDDSAYFSDSIVEVDETTTTLREAIPRLEGKIVLEGDSGLGKTMFLRHRLRQSTRISAFLPASRCAGGVAEAIGAMLAGPMRDPPYLQTLIHNGAIDICIDGLNEVSPDIRSVIRAFASRPHLNLIVTTQDIGWRAPVGSKLVRLQPLEEPQITGFLLQPGRVRDPDATLQGDAYETACRVYVTTALDPTMPAEDLEATRIALSNPMDLTVVAEMIARGQTPDIFELREQQIRQMSADYRRRNMSEFPLPRFADAAYKRMVDHNDELPHEEFPAELEALLEHKMVIKRIPAVGEKKEQWRFRHDKFRDFFLANAMLPPHKDRQVCHFDDARFRSVYLALATLMPLEDAFALREALIQHASRTGDHTVMDRYVQILTARTAVERRRWA
ncbi:MAG: hypothetical protein GY715_06150 [Planctomycetes bacterium]|nr:hypothetical protein [Planctomycetota bacterium]